MLSEIRTRRVLFDPLAVVCLLGLLLGAPDSYAQTLPVVVATIDVGNFPFGVAVNPFTNRIYVASRSGGVSVIDGATNAVVATVPVTRAFGVGVNPATDRVYVTRVSQNRITVIDGASNTVVTNITGGGGPQRVGVNLFTNCIYVPNLSDPVSLSGTVSVIDGAINSIVATVAVGDLPSGVGVNPFTNRIYVSNQLSDTVSVIDGNSNTVVATIAVGDHPRGVRVDPVRNLIYVANNVGGTLSVIDGDSDTVTATVDIGIFPNDVAVNPITNRIYITHSVSISVLDGDTNSVVATVPVEDSWGLEVNPFTDLIYAASRRNNTLSVIAELPPPALILQLMDNVVSLNLPQGIENSLDAKLNAALKQLDENSESNAVAALSAPEDTSENCNNVAACNILEAFINAVEAQSTKKIPLSDADALVAAAIEIILLLCPE